MRTPSEPDRPRIDKPLRGSLIKGNSRQLALAATAAVLCLCVLPLVYGWLIFGEIRPAYMRGVVLAHFGFNCIANLLVMLSALLLKGRFDRKLAGVLTVVLMVHGTLAFLILTTRSFYSIQLMLTSASVSVLMGALAMYLQHKSAIPKVALLGAVDTPPSKLWSSYDRVRDPEVDLRRYDILLTDSVVDLSAEWAQVISKALIAGKSVRHVVEYTEEQQGIVSVDHFELDHLPPIGLAPYRVGKRLMDLGIVFFLLPILIPAIFVGAFLVLLSTGAPIFFLQSRVGLGGKVFTMYKIRTMRVASERAGLATGAEDDRVTAVGRYLRRYRIDELPQILNVLKGDMSIIGPRPEWTVLVDQYSKSLPAYAYRHLVRPGITGWAQVRGGYASSLAETREKVGFDLFYIKNLSLSLDIQILVRTVWTLLAGVGAR